MTPAERWQRVEQLYHAALARPADERQAYLRGECRDDPALLHEVESLLAHEQTAEKFLGVPAAEVAAAGMTDAGHSLVGRPLGAYQVRALVGAGGMGEVYRARDMKLGRDVAIKVLPRVFTTDPERLARFEREARLLAALNHPNIAAIYGIEDAGGVRALVLELVEGETLAEKLAAGPLPVAAALATARQIADALEAAHEKGIIHRDLKPANIKITPAGVVKVLDFGLAKLAPDASEGGAGDPANTESPTVTVGGTRDGAILGTAAYMSPEQARGQPVDRRADIWSFGCVLYELLTARNAFARGTMADTLAAVVQSDPDWEALPVSTPQIVARLVRRCLEKDPRRRLHDIGDARIDLDEALEAPAERAEKAAVSARAVSARPSLMLISVAGLVVAAAALAALYFRRLPDQQPTTRLSVSAPGQITPQLSAAISPDGRRVAFVSTDPAGRSMLWIRDLDSLEPRVLSGTEDAAHPFWSPDGTALGFLAGGKLKRVDAGGGPVLTIADVATRWGASWGRTGVILFVPRIGELGAVAATGGLVATVLTRGEALWPFFLPDGRHFLFVDRSGPPDTRGVYVGSLDEKGTTKILATDLKAAYADPGYLLFVRGETVLARPFDASRLTLTGEPTVVAEGIWTAPGGAQASFSVSQTGVLAYINATLWNLQLRWVDRGGRALESVGPPNRYYDEVPQISPDGSRVAIARGPLDAEDLWVLNPAAGTETRLTFDPSGDSEPIWSADGRRILFQSQRDAKGLGLYLKDASGAGSEEAVAVIARDSHVWDWSRDGRFVVYSTIGERRVADLWILPLDGDHTPVPYAQSSFHKTQAQISPNGRWIAYTSYESGRDEVYVQSFPTPGSRRQISTAGGMQPRWRRDGAELFYLGSDQTLMAVPVATGGAFEAGRPSPLFRTRIVPQGSQSVWFDTMYDVAPDGQRFLFNWPPEDLGPPITVVLNWVGSLKK